MSINAVVFDYGQVITFPQESSALDRLAQLAGSGREEFEEVLWKERPDFDRGLLNPKEYFRRVLSCLGISKDDDTIDEMIRVDFDSWKKINPETVTLMEELKKEGYILGILSNMPRDFLVWARENESVLSIPQVCVFSCEHFLIKPEAAIYYKLLSLIGVEAEELVFFDDSLKNVNAAKALGIAAYLWEDPQAARKVLRTLGARV